VDVKDTTQGGGSLSGTTEIYPGPVEKDT
jgi:hypothetical protein